MAAPPLARPLSIWACDASPAAALRELRELESAVPAQPLGVFRRGLYVEFFLQPAHAVIIWMLSKNPRSQSYTVYLRPVSTRGSHLQLNVLLHVHAPSSRQVRMAP